MKKLETYLSFSPEVEQALQNKQPVLALESTIISHGMPYPQNVETALAVEEVVKQEGVVPATMAVLDGKLCIGLSHKQIETLGNLRNVTKVSLRDLPYVVSQRLPGSTTVATTMRMASMAGISVFATGGIGGVHRGAENNMDISADLTEMGQTSVAIVSAGVKSILDIGLTLEYLETLGVPVVTFGQKEFPSFYSSKSKFRSPMQLNDVPSLALLLKSKWEMGLEGAILIANPVPAAYEIDAQTMEKYIEDALAAAGSLNIEGKDVTPFLLKTIAENTQGESLQANIALIKNNALLGARLAKAYSGLINLDH
jgi:pseudouridine-5'-phosphate glycosidase